MTSQIESFSSTQYTPLYKNEQFESKIIQWILLEVCMKTILFHSYQYDIGFQVEMLLSSYPDFTLYDVISFLGM